MKRIIFLLFAIVLSFNISAQQLSNSIAVEELKVRKEIYVKIDLPTDQGIKQQLEKLNKVISIDSYDQDKNSATAYVTIHQFNSFIELGLDYELLTPPSLLLDRSELDGTSTKGTNDWDYYPNYMQYVNMMTQFELDYPGLCEVVSIGQSNEGREILFLHINNNLGEDVDEPEFMYTSSIHGDEITGYVLMLRLSDYLLTNYGVIDKVTNLVDNIDIWINPLANPDGTFAGGNNSVYGATRSNAMGVDMNRNYADPEDGNHPDGNQWQTETVLFMDFAEERDFVMSANFHGGAEVMNYPWDTWSKLAADDVWWNFVSRAWADTVHLYSPSGYMNDLDNGVTNGYQWYSISGGRQDYMNYFHHCREVTVEISSTKLPPASQMPTFWDYNYRSLLNYMEAVLYGARGVVTDYFSGNPIVAKVFIAMHDKDESYIYSSMPAGNYHRLLKQGLYNLTFSAYGYYDKTISMVNISDYQTEILDIELEPNVGLVGDKKVEISIYPNPANEFVSIKLPENDTYLIKLIDESGRLIFNEVIDNNFVNIKLSNFTSGNYIVSVTDKDANISNYKLVID